MKHTYYTETSLINPIRIKSDGTWLGMIFFGLLTLLYAVFFVRNFSGPLAETVPGDTDQWEYMGYYVLENLSFTPLPHLNWVSNQTFFPYGTNHVFQGWALESNVWFAVCYRFFGPGPWLNIYYLLSLFIAGTGTYLLLRADYGNRRAGLAGLLVTFLNFYALNKYPGHFAYSVVHWTILSVLTDFLLVRRIVLYQAIPLQLVLLKALVLALCLGMDVGYMLGYALSSFTLSVAGAGCLVAYRAVRQPAPTSAWLRQTLAAWPHQWRPVQSAAMVFVTMLAALFYVPLLVEVTRQSETFVFADRFAGGHGWMHPLRLLLPYFPGFSAIDNPFANRLHDMPEGPGAGSPGWLLLGLAGVGYWHTPKAVRWAYVPLGVFFLLHVVYHPIRLPFLQIFPWCRYNRIPSRVTLIYPVIAAILSLYLPGKPKPAIWLPLLLVGIVEVGTVYQYRYAWQPYYFPASFGAYMERVRQQPGEAVLDWPFCVTGGNGVGGADGLCPLFLRNSTLYALKRFHGKKTVGQYFGRLHESQIQPFLRAGWPALLVHTDSPDFVQARTLTSCLSDEQWAFFDRFYEYNDFAGINLCVDLMPDSCVQMVYARYGASVAATYIPGIGHITFIPKSAISRTHVNARLGKLIRFPCGCKADSLTSRL